MIRIAVATHKEYNIPDDPLYITVAAGAALGGHFPASYKRDDSGGNISEKNLPYSELTALYWLWKNPDLFCGHADSVGMCHYRRYFAVRRGISTSILSEQDVKELSLEAKVILPRKRNYVIESNYSHYANSHNKADLDITREIISEWHPEYLSAYDRRMAMRTGHRFNMFIMPVGTLDAYCSWLFDILFEVEKRLDVSSYCGRDRRVLGLIAERLLDVWLDKNGIRYIELPYVMTEREHLLIKGLGLVFRKIRGFAVRKH